jgi:phosphotransferase system  glucose/maltose/N-acetylglucosamine-specific IIC component
MFGDLEWLIWFIIVGIFITIIYMITMHFVLKKGRVRSGELEISYLEEKLIEEENRLVEEEKKVTNEIAR